MLKPAEAGQPEFSLAEARRIVGDLFNPNPVVYWVDFLLTIGVGHFCFSAVRNIPYWMSGFSHPPWLEWGLRGLCFAVSCLLYYRAAMFIHELVHLRSGTFTGFRIAWNLLCGIPFLMPSFVYYTHLDHHRRKHFGTEQDGEYLPLGSRSPWHIILYLAQSFVIPPLAVFRFFILTPLTWISPAVRRWVHQRASSMVIDPWYIRPHPTPGMLRLIRVQELLCFLFCLGVAIVPPLFLDRWPIPFLIQAYLTGVTIVMINAVRTLGAHRYYNNGQEMTFLDQVLDSVNYPHRPLVSELWGPTGTRYHALHHLFPSLPYHAMGQAHRRLMARLPADSPYRATEEGCLWNGLADLWKRASRSNSPSRPAQVASTA
jgi:fatty acid desaturase